MFVFRKKYFISAILLLIIETFIALYVKDGFTRPYLGDFLVVIFLYCLFRSFLRAPVLKVAVAVLLLAYLIELGQYFRLIFRLGLEDYLLAHLILGSSFHWFDMLAYTLGIIFVLILERITARKAQHPL